MRFSVIVCTYNYAHLLPDTLRSIAAQSLSDFELLVVDDGSTDNTEEVFAGFRSAFQDYRYLKRPHAGIADARNAGVRAANGSHIAFLDADDLWAPRYLRTFRGAFDANPGASLALSDGLMFWSKKGLITDTAPIGELPPLCGPVKSHRDLFPLLQCLSPSGMVFSKDLYNQVGPFDTQSFAYYGEDIDWTLRALISGAFCVCLKQKLYLYRRHDANLTNQASRSFQSWLTIYSRTLREGCSDRQVEALARRVIRSNSVRVLPTCSKCEGQELLRSGIETLGGDSWIRLCYFGTHLGLVGMLRIFKAIKRISRRLLRKKLAIDLSAPSEDVFNALPE